MKTEDACRLDEEIVREVRGYGAIDLALGAVLARLFEGDRLVQLGYARQVDYARERLGVPPRTVYAWVRLARGLRELPLLRRAVVLGATTPRKALTVLASARDDEPYWTAAAMTLTLRQLESAVRAEGKEPPPEFEVESLRLRMSPAQQDRLDAALAHAQRSIGPGAPRWQCLEAICQEWLGAFSDVDPPAPPDEPTESDESDAVAPKIGREAVERALALLDDAGPLAEDDEPEAEDAPSLDAQARRLLEARRGYDRTFGALVERIARERVHRTLGYASFEEYCRERLGLAARTVRERVWLERRMRALPPLRAALASGRLTYSKALLLAQDATAEDVEARIEEASSTTWQQTERDTTEREERRNRAAGVRRLWGPKEAAETVVHAIACARVDAARRGEPIDAGEALARVADHFVATWEEHSKCDRKPPERREKVLMRHGGLCAAPGCSRCAVHVHHIVFRSHGGSADLANEVALCAVHHLRGVHRGYLRVVGRAGERLLWFLGTGEVYETRGDDDVRRTERRAQERWPYAEPSSCKRRASSASGA